MPTEPPETERARFERMRKHAILVAAGDAMQRELVRELARASMQVDHTADIGALPDDLRMAALRAPYPERTLAFPLAAMIERTLRDAEPYPPPVEPLPM